MNQQLSKSNAGTSGASTTGANILGGAGGGGLQNGKHKVNLSADIFFVNSIPFLITLSRNIRFITGDRLQNRKVGTILSALVRVFNLYLRRGFKVVMCSMD